MSAPHGARRSPPPTPDENAIVKQYVPLAHKMARRFAKGPHYEDAVAAAMVGVLLAARTYDPTKGASFLTHATNRAKWEVCRLLYGGHPMMTRGQATRVRRTKVGVPAPMVSIEMVPKFSDRVPDNDVEPADSAVAAAEGSARLRAAIAELPPKMRDVCQMLIVEELPPIAIAARLGVTRQRIDQILQAALLKLREAMGVTMRSGAVVPLDPTERSGRGRGYECSVCLRRGHNASLHKTKQAAPKAALARTPGTRRTAAKPDAGTTRAVLRQRIAERSATRKAKRQRRRDLALDAN